MADQEPPAHRFDLSRRRFLYGISAGVLAPPAMAWIGPGAATTGADFEAEAAALLRDWCDGMLRQQIHDPAQPSRDGALDCPACRRIHGRCGDAILPLLAMAARSGEMRYRDAALALWKWMKNVDAPDGAWTNEPDPKSWKGTTVFSAIALIESLEWHADLLNAETQAAMRSRLAKAGEYIKKNFNTEFGNINYAAAGALALSGLGKLLDAPQFTQRGDELAQQALAFFTPKDRLLFGEGRPSNQRSPKGCYPVDLGYNIAESLPSLIHYALTANSKDVLDAAVESLKTHMNFMLPDGGWDNSWGTRSYKWTYWGSRTADGVMSVLVRLAGQDPAFATAAWRSLRLVRDCTRDGLLLGGPHYADHGVPACVHHTFVHAKTVTGALHYLSKPLPAEIPERVADGVRHFPELAVYQVRSGPWRASFSGYDWFYRPNLKQATGGTAGMVWHAQLGPLLAAGLAEYVPVEEHNLQPQPAGCEEPVSCRIECRSPAGELYSNLFDAAAVLRHDGPRIAVEASLVSRLGASPEGGAFKVSIEYLFAQDSLTITVRPEFSGKMPWSLVVPVISRRSESVVAKSDSQWEIHKPGGTLVVDSSNPIEPSKLAGERAFSLCPGFQVLPVRISSSDQASVSCKLTFRR
jgi:hypothetical protein